MSFWNPFKQPGNNDSPVELDAFEYLSLQITKDMDAYQKQVTDNLNPNCLEEYRLAHEKVLGDARGAWVGAEDKNIDLCLEYLNSIGDYALRRCFQYSMDMALNIKEEQKRLRERQAQERAREARTINYIQNNFDRSRGYQTDVRGGDIQIGEFHD